MSLEGAIRAVIEVRDDQVVRATITATRRVSLAAALRGKTVADAVALMPLVFPSCGVAHGAAAASAVESATGVGDDASRRARARVRAILVASEALEGHAWSALVAWPELVGAAPAIEGVRLIRAATASLRGAIDPERVAMRIAGDVPLPARATVDAALERIERAVSVVLTGLPRDERDVAAWADASSFAAARLVEELAGVENAGIGASDVAPLEDLAPAWFASRLAANATFGELPTFDGSPREAGALAREAHHPLVASVLARHGRGALARVAARLAELASLPGRLRALARTDEPASATPLAADGCGVSDTARGRLAHWAQVDRGMVVDWRCVAPTEWTFHPDGAFVRGLVGDGARTRRPDLERAVRLHVAALDPCVPCELAFRQATNEVEAR